MDCEIYNDNSNDGDGLGSYVRYVKIIAMILMVWSGM